MTKIESLAGLLPGDIFKDITRGEGAHEETLYLADECGHIQWLDVGDIEFGTNNVHCETCDTYGILSTWRRVYVKA